MPDTSAPLPNASVPRRLAALVYDAFLLFGLLVVPLLILTALLHGGPHPPGNDSVAHELPPIAPKWLLQTYWALVVAGFYCYFWRRSGQTLGMQAWRLRLDSDAGGRPGWRQCALRLLVGIPSLLLAGLGYWWSWLDPQRRSWHDRASRTHVVVLPKRGKASNYA